MAAKKPDYAEISRRHAATTGAPQETAPTVPRPAGMRNLRDTDRQSYALINLAHVNRNPKSDKGGALRIIGFYGTEKEAQQNGARIAKSDPACAIAIVETCSWYVLTRDQSVVPEEVASKLARMLAAHKRSRIERKVEFEKHRQELRGERKPTSQQVADNPCEEAITADSEIPPMPPKLSKPPTTRPSLDNGNPVPEFSKILEQRNYEAAAISILDDYEAEGVIEDAEVGFIIYGGFESDEAAQGYVEHVAKRAVPDHDVAVVRMYEWLYPQCMESDSVNQVERNAELNRIMAARRARESEVEAFKAACKDLNMEAPFKDVLPDLKEDGTPLNPDAELQPGKSRMKLTDVSPPEPRVTEVIEDSGSGGAIESKEPR